MATREVSSRNRQSVWRASGCLRLRRASNSSSANSVALMACRANQRTGKSRDRKSETGQAETRMLAVKMPLRNPQVSGMQVSSDRPFTHKHTRSHGDPCSTSGRLPPGRILCQQNAVVGSQSATESPHIHSAIDMLSRPCDLQTTSIPDRPFDAHIYPGTLYLHRDLPLMESDE